MGRGGFEPPTHGFSVRCSKNVNADKTKTCENTKEQLTPQLTPDSQKQAQNTPLGLPADLADIVGAWSTLPEHVRQAIVTLVASVTVTAQEGDEVV